jgi:hypothetical protein
MVKPAKPSPAVQRAEQKCQKDIEKKSVTTDNQLQSARDAILARADKLRAIHKPLLGRVKEQPAPDSPEIQAIRANLMGEGALNPHADEASDTE